MKKHIPNFITLLNLLSGCIGVVLTARGNPEAGAWLIFIAAIFDFLDGFAARLLQVKTDIGKQLDSLADVISFGLLPGAILFTLIESGLEHTHIEGPLATILPFAGFLVTLFSALRLAKFNIDERQEEVFYGLPTPANAMLIAGLPLILNQQTTLSGLQIGFIQTAIHLAPVLVVLSVVLSWLLVSNLQMMSLKFKSYDWASNQHRYLLLTLSGLWLILFGFAGIPMILFSYIILSFMAKDQT